MIYSFVFFATVISIFLYFNKIPLNENFTDSLNTEEDFICVNDIFNHTVPLQNNIYGEDNSENLEEVLTSYIHNPSDINKIIKYIEGIEWNEWCDDINEKHVLINQSLIEIIQNKIKKYEYEIVQNRINKYREDRNSNEKIIIDSDIALYNNAQVNAYHLKMLYYVDLVTNKVDIVTVKLIGKIDERYVFNDGITYLVKNAAPYKENSHKKYLGNINLEDTTDNLIKDDKKTSDILYNKIIKDDCIDDDDYVKNIVFKKNHDVVRKMFLDNLNKVQKPVNSRYKTYPIDNDFVLQQK